MVLTQHNKRARVRKVEEGRNERGSRRTSITEHSSSADRELVDDEEGEEEEDDEEVEDDEDSGT
jgi:hypothetical protein